MKGWIPVGAECPPGGAPPPGQCGKAPPCPHQRNLGGSCAPRQRSTSLGVSAPGFGWAQSGRGGLNSGTLRHTPPNILGEPSKPKAAWPAFWPPSSISLSVAMPGPVTAGPSAPGVEASPDAAVATVCLRSGISSSSLGFAAQGLWPFCSALIAGGSAGACPWGPGPGASPGRQSDKRGPAPACV